MPCLEISMPRQNPSIRERLTRALTNDFAENANYDVSALGIRFYEYYTGEAANGGINWDGKTGKPYIHFKLYIPKRTEQEKRDLIKAFTSSFTRCTGRPDWEPVIYFIELDDDSIGFGGESLAEHKRNPQA
jgi:phenylpyruvate tautomerase PptA (4-oxalocrotonate tautomerase family)